ncbi:hypothetical protein BJV82DRAFT_635873 [Fennellomyces sp. T-0311]|nr:hypothetical protein BJV82DRAFT_635873 [Fennellomyces sp. T-0311]
MNFKTLSALLFIACIAAVARAQQAPALTSLASLMSSEQAAGQTALYNSASSAYSRISSEIHRSATHSEAAKQTFGGQSSGNGNNNRPTATAQGQNSGHNSAASAFEMSNVMLVQATAWATLFVASFAAMFA